MLPAIYGKPDLLLPQGLSNRDLNTTKKYEEQHKNPKGAIAAIDHAATGL